MIEISTGIYPYNTWLTPFEQLKQVVEVVVTESKRRKFETGGGPDVFFRLFRALSEAISVRRSSCGVEYFLKGANFLRDAGLRGGLDLMNSRMISWASFLTLNGNCPSSVLTLFNLYLKK